MEKQPRYEAVVKMVAERIRSGELKPGDRLEGEYDLAQKLGVGRSSVREGLRLLQRAGYLESRNGVGSFVLKRPAKPVQNSLNELRSLGEMIADAGCAVGSRGLWVRHLAGEPDWCAKLALPEDAAVVAVLRERWAGERQIALVLNVFPQALVGGGLDDGIPEGAFRRLEEGWGVTPRSALTRFKGLDPGCPWDREAVKALGAPVLRMEQLHFDEDENPVFFSIDYIRTDLMDLTLRRERKLEHEF